MTRARIVLASLLVVSSGPLALAQFQGPPPSQPVSPKATGPAGLTGVKTPDVRDMSAFQLVKIVPGDELEINVVGLTQPSPQIPGAAGSTAGTFTPIHQTVNADGRVLVTYIGFVDTADQTPNELAGRISKKLTDEGFILNPQVTVTVTSAPSQQASVQGEVQSPGLMPIPGQRTLLDMLASAGGLKATASHLITINRANGEVVQVLLDSNPTDTAAGNLPIYPGDSILVPRAGQVYVVGSVHTQQAIPLQTNTPFTLLQALTTAGGPGFEAALSHTIIIRTEGHERKEISLDVKKVLHGEQPDPILQADDIVYVPGNGFKAAIKGQAVSTAVSLVYGLAFIAGQ